MDAQAGPWIDLSRAPDGTLVIVPGAAWATKCLSAKTAVAVGVAWEGPVAVVGGPDEAVLCKEVSRGIPGSVVIAEVGFASVFSVLSRAEAVVAGDTGLMHLAAACGVPVVALFGPTSPDDGFWVHPGAVVESDLPCRPCSLHGDDSCPLGHHRCMDHDAEEVSAALAAALR